MIQSLAPLLLSFVSRDFGAALQRTKRNGLLYLLAGILLLTAYGAGLAAAMLLLSETYGSVAALFALAIGALALAVAVLAGVLMLQRIERKKAVASPAGKAMLAVAAATLLPIVLKSRTLTGLATLGVIALLASRGGGVDAPKLDGSEPL